MTREQAEKLLEVIDAKVAFAYQAARADWDGGLHEYGKELELVKEFLSMFHYQESEE